MNRFVYVCHPYGDDPAGNAAAMRSICQTITDAGDIPIAPALYFPQWLDESDPDDRERGLEMACAMVRLCREVRVYGPVTSGMRREIDAAHEARIPVGFMYSEDLR
jgi:dienelactone hydrolase